ncbi:hypothetical protein TWF696_008825 [Orbilia brochopaga]|uniref:Uncharacterized protein n=1 Tax=Orbilia brochopaga TaxID=3140254 RepID=A0AAV9UH39_9PEZI
MEQSKGESSHASATDNAKVISDKEAVEVQPASKEQTKTMERESQVDLILKSEGEAIKEKVQEGDHEEAKRLRANLIFSPEAERTETGAAYKRGDYKSLTRAELTVRVESLQNLALDLTKQLEAKMGIEEPTGTSFLPMMYTREQLDAKPSGSIYNMFHDLWYMVGLKQEALAGNQKAQYMNTLAERVAVSSFLGCVWDTLMREKPPQTDLRLPPGAMTNNLKKMEKELRFSPGALDASKTPAVPANPLLFHLRASTSLGNLRSTPDELELLLPAGDVLLEEHQEAMSNGSWPRLTRSEYEELTRLAPSRSKTHIVKYLAWAEVPPFIPDDADVFEYIHHETSYTLATYMLCQQLFVQFFDKIWGLIVRTPRSQPRKDKDAYNLLEINQKYIEKLYNEIFDEGQKLSNLMDEIILYQFNLSMPFFSRDVIKALKHGGTGNPLPRIAFAKQKILKFLEHVMETDQKWGPIYQQVLSGFNTTFEEISSHKEMILKEQMTFSEHEKILKDRQTLLDEQRSIESEQDRDRAHKELAEELHIRNLLPGWNEEWAVPKYLREALKGRGRVLQRCCRDLRERDDVLTTRELRDVNNLFNKIQRELDAAGYRSHEQDQDQENHGNGFQFRARRLLGKANTRGRAPEPIVNPHQQSSYKEKPQHRNTGTITSMRVMMLSKAIEDSLLIEEEQRRGARRGWGEEHQIFGELILAQEIDMDRRGKSGRIRSFFNRLLPSPE